jgi:hypothetical protein
MTPARALLDPVTSVLPGLSLPLALLLVLGWYLSWSAARLDRLHHRVESSRAALDAHLARRAATAIEAAAVLDPASGMILAAAGAESLAAGAARAAAGERAGPVAEEVENDLTRALLDTLADPAEVAGLRRAPLAADLLDALAAACTRVQLARRFHNDAVAQAQRVRRKRVVRWGHLAGRAAMPAMVEFDDSLPEGLVQQD